MNENFIEEENTVYEIDPNCRIEPVQREKKEWKRQSCSEKRGNGNCCLLLLLLFLCNKNG